MLAHRLRHRITFLRESQGARDADNRLVPGSGGWVVASLPDGTLLDGVPAEVLTGAGREFHASGATQSDTSARINLRWFPAADHELATWRVRWDGRTYNIQSVETDVTARREWRLRCVDGPSERE